MFNSEITAQFKKDLRLGKRRGKDLEKLKTVMGLVLSREKLPLAYRDHPLLGNYTEHRECHVGPDDLLIYKVLDPEKVVIFVRYGTHSDLFN